MALELKLEYSVDPNINTITVKEITGAYDINNLNGWGNPNTEKNSVAMVLYVTYQPYNSTEQNLSELYSGNIYFYHPLAENNVDAYFSLPYTNDGWYKFTVTVVSLTEINENRIFYDTVLQKLQIIKNGVPTDLALEDWVNLRDKDQYNSITLSEILLLKLVKQRNCQLEKYFECMLCSTCKCQNEREEYEKLNALIQATDYRFYSEKEFEAQRMVEFLTKQFKCCK